MPPPLQPLRGCPALPELSMTICSQAGSEISPTAELDDTPHNLISLLTQLSVRCSGRHACLAVVSQLAAVCQLLGQLWHAHCVAWQGDI